MRTITLAEIILEKLKHHALNQRSPARSGIENRWPKGKAKVNIDNQALKFKLNPKAFCFLFSGRAVDGHQTVLSVLLFDNHLLVVDDVDAIAQVQFAH